MIVDQTHTLYLSNELMQLEFFKHQTLVATQNDSWNENERHGVNGPGKFILFT